MLHDFYRNTNFYVTFLLEREFIMRSFKVFCMVRFYESDPEFIFGHSIDNNLDTHHDESALSMDDSSIILAREL